MVGLSEKLRLKGKEIVIGFGNNNGRIVVKYYAGGITFVAGDSGIVIAPQESITTQITPDSVMCDSFFFLHKRIVGFQLGRNRFLSASYMGKGDLHVCYLPDEADLEYGRSEFMNRCANRGLM